MIPVVVQSPPPGQQNTQNPAISYPNPVVMGNLLVLDLNWANTSGAVASVRDNLGNNWQQVAFQQPTGSVRTQYSYACVVTKAGNLTITVSTDAARVYTWSIFEVNGALITLDGTPVYMFGSTTGAAAPTGVLTTQKANSIIFAFAKAGTISVSPSAPWITQTSTNHGTAYQVGANPGPYSTSWTSSAVSNWATTILAFQAAPSVPATTAVGDTENTFLAKGNKALGGTGTFPTYRLFTLLAVQYRLLSGSGAQPSDNEFTLLAKINKYLGGTGTTPSDNVFTLLAKQNRLLGGSGARVSDTVFTLFAKNSKLLHH